MGTFDLYEGSLYGVQWLVDKRPRCLTEFSEVKANSGSNSDLAAPCAQLVTNSVTAL